MLISILKCAAYGVSEAQVREQGDQLVPASNRKNSGGRQARTWKATAM
jgi:hypothetical protein